MAIKFRPVRGKEETIKKMEKTEGYIYFATDTGKIYLDTSNDTRISVGGSSSGGGNSSIFYANADTVNEFSDGYYHISMSDLEDDTLITIPNDAIIINKDGAFYRVIKVENGTIYCTNIAVSGGSGGTTTKAKKISIDLEKKLNISSYINGQSAYAIITPHSGENTEGTKLDQYLTVTWKLATKSGSDYVTYATGTIDLTDGEAYEFDFGSRAKESSTSYLFVEATGIKSGTSESMYFNFVTMDLTLEASSSFSNTSVYSYDNVIASVNISGNMEKIVDYYFDNELVHSDTLPATSDVGQSCKFNTYLSNITHGYHTIKVALFQSIQGTRGVGPDPIEMEIAVNAGGDDAIIWLGKYQTEYYSYDDISIPYYVYNPANLSGFTVDLLKDNGKIGSREFANLTNGLVSASFEITDAETGIQNYYSITCGDTTRRDIYFNVVQDPNRDMNIQKQLYLDLSFDAKGRSNDESATERNTLEFGDIKAEFNNFNWYNNGWITDDDNKTCLRISNGASLSIPIGKITFADSTNQKSQSHTFEFQFKIRNVQNFDSLIKNITRYKNDSVYYDAFYGYISYTEDTTNTYNINNDYFLKDGDNYVSAGITNATTYDNVRTNNTLYIGTEGYKTSYTNYDAFLKYYCDLNGLSYDDITTDNYDYTEKKYNLSAIACGYYSGKAKAPIGFGLGPQDAFFTNGTNTVNASYVENKLINLTISYNHTNKLMSIYVNGILTGVIFSTLDNPFTINNDSIVFSSNICDIDLYKFRIYNTALSLNDVVTNYAVDLKDVEIYDQNAIAVENNTINEYEFNFKNMLSYNEAHPSDPIMPYIVFDTSESDNDDRLSWSKSTNVTIGVEFVNTVLDRAYESGELDDLANKDGVTVEEYYTHHCPSWKGTNINMAVQGTSSQFYPRRNYKIKTKDSNKVIHMTMHKGPFATNNTDTKWFYMDNYSVGTNKFTMKVDFMESSGSYNRGLANLLNNAYSKHPLDYYLEAGALSKAVDSYVEATSFEEGTQYYYYNHKGNIKPADGSSDNIPTLTAETFAKGPVSVYADLRAADSTTYSSTKVITDSSSPYYNKWYVGGTTYQVTKDGDFSDLRTTVQGFPALAFHKKSDETYTYIGKYNILTDKGSDETYGLKGIDDYMLHYLDDATIEDVAEGWEFENNARGFCSFRDPNNRKTLSFNTNSYVATQLAPSVVEDFEYRYNSTSDALDILAGEKATNLNSLTPAEVASIKKVTKVEPTTTEKAQDLILDIYGNWEKAVRWVWSTALDASFVKTEAQIATLTDEEKEEYLIKDYFKVSDDATLDASKTYYKYLRHLYKEYTPTEETWAQDLIDGLYTYDAYTKTYGEVTYTYDSYEYRYDKFKNELEDHFNLDYLATYFVMTEVLELYDSRGKNCMMLSWGPMKQGGDYIWFPTFYDMDTQLGINNTGIPSFDYYIDATDEGSFSTNDSVLWNNFYKVFTSQITQKYCQLKGQTDGIGTFDKLDYAPLASVARIEGWYESDPTICKSIAMRGVRPLSAINLDEYYKYISITNGKGLGYLGQTGEYIYDNESTSTGSGSPKGSFFYALQGDRSLSRQQFLTNRINYLESWLGVGSYAKNSSSDTAFWGRFRANGINADTDELTGLISDVWVENKASTNHYSDYYEADGVTKKNEFDAEYWLTLTPARKSYARVVADDSVSSKKYTDTPVKVVMESREDPVRTSFNLNESLFYLLGVDIMQSLGNLHNLYITELHTIDAPNLTELILGWDGLDDNGKPYYNHDTNRHTFSSMPLLKELNLSNIQYKSDVDKTLSFTSCEKLQNFRATGSNFTQIKFAEGVALNTLYLPSTITELKLTEARQLKNVITTYETPIHNKATDKLEANPGLYIEHFTDYLDDYTNASCICNIATLSIIDAANLGYDAYKLLKGYYNKRKLDKENSQIAMTEVDWTPYKKVDAGSIYSDQKTYVKDNYHFGFNSYTYDADTWNSDISNGVLYVLNEDLDGSIIKDLSMLEDMAKSDSYFKSTSGTNIPNITGTIYIDNDFILTTNDGIEIDEDYVRNTLLSQYPGITFFFKNINKNYTARFILVDEDDNRLYQTIGVQTIKEEWFTEPIDAYGDISELKANYDFYGWANKADAQETEVLINADRTINKWSSQSLNTDVYDYTFYAIFSIHKYIMTFINGDGTEYILKVPYGETLSDPRELSTNPFVAYKDDSELAYNMTYAFDHWSTTEDGDAITLTNYRSSKNRTFYANFIEDDVHNHVTNASYFNITYQGILSPKVALKGKITIPSKLTLDGQEITVTSIGGFKCSQNTETYFAEGIGQDVTGVFFLEDSKLTGIESSAFENCDFLKYFEYPKTLVSIGTSAFKNCWALESCDLSECTKLTSISSQAFADSWNTREKTIEIKLPKSVTTIGLEAFSYAGFNNVFKWYYYCYKYSFDEIGQYGEVFCSKFIPSVQLGDILKATSITTIGSSAFTGVEKIILYYNNQSSEEEQKLETMFKDYALDMRAAY